MWEQEDTVARLSGPASKVLLSLGYPLSRAERLTQEEFAILSGQTRRSVLVALRELEVNALLTIVPQPVTRGPLAANFLPQEGYETNVQVPFEAPAPAPDGLVLEARVREGSVRVSDPTVLDRRDTNGSPDLMERCRLADEAGNKQEQMEALRQVWASVFPGHEYPFQQLSDDAARKFLANGRKAEFVAEVMIDATSNATERIRNPRPFITTAIENEEKRRAKRGVDLDVGDGGTVITDDIRALLDMGRRQFGHGGDS